jgi:hypothetical protein
MHPWLIVLSVLISFLLFLLLFSLCRLNWRWKTRRRDNATTWQGQAHTLSKGGWRCSVYRISPTEPKFSDICQGHSPHEGFRARKVIYNTISMSEGLQSAGDCVQRYSQVLEDSKGIELQAWPSCIISSIEIALSGSRPSGYHLVDGENMKNTSPDAQQTPGKLDQCKYER